VRDKRERHKLQCEHSLAQFDAWWQRVSGHPARNVRPGLSSAVLTLALVIFLMCAAVQPSLGWGRDGHKIVNRVAVETLPATMPAFLRSPSSRNEIEYLGPEPDRWRSFAAPELSAEQAPEHFLDMELANLAAPDGLPARRYEFLRDLDAAQRLHPTLANRLAPQRVGLLPWQVEEDFERLQLDIARIQKAGRRPPWYAGRSAGGPV
ncbi:MAG: hypothetical protein ABI076_00050, partial [Acidobacteriaceae bacterium]